MATASLTCSASDRNLSFELVGNIGSGDGASVQITEGEIKLKEARGKYPAATFQIEPGHIAILTERTKSVGADLDRYRGQYVLKVYGPKGQSELKGELKDCEAG